MEKLKELNLLGLMLYDVVDTLHDLVVNNYIEDIYKIDKHIVPKEVGILYRGLSFSNYEYLGLEDTLNSLDLEDIGVSWTKDVKVAESFAGLCSGVVVKAENFLAYNVSNLFAAAVSSLENFRELVEEVENRQYSEEDLFKYTEFDFYNTYDILDEKLREVYMYVKGENEYVYLSHSRLTVKSVDTEGKYIVVTVSEV